MPMFEVELMRTVSATVHIEAEDAESALDRASRADYPLPPQDLWHGHKDWKIRVYDGDGAVVAESDS